MFCSPVLCTSWDARTNQPTFLRISIQQQLKSGHHVMAWHMTRPSVTFIGMNHRIVWARALWLSWIVDVVGLFSFFFCFVFINTNFIRANSHFSDILDEQITAVVVVFSFWVNILWILKFFHYSKLLIPSVHSHTTIIIFFTPWFSERSKIELDREWTVNIQWYYGKWLLWTWIYPLLSDPCVYCFILRNTDHIFTRYWRLAVLFLSVAGFLKSSV